MVLSLALQVLWRWSGGVCVLCVCFVVSGLGPNSRQQQPSPSSHSKGLGFRLQGFGFRVQGLGFRFRV
jgi:hypothetical protein